MNENICITIDEKHATFPMGTTVLEVLKNMLPSHEVSTIFSTLWRGQILSLSTELYKDATLSPLTYAHEESRRIYERTLRFVLLYAVKRLGLMQRVRILNSVSHGLYLRVTDTELTVETVHALEEEMRKLVQLKLPIYREEYTKEEAIAYFDKQGWYEKAELLRSSPKNRFTLYSLDGYKEFFYGDVLPHTGYVPTFSLKPHFPGLVMMFPTPQNPTFPAQYSSRAKFLRVFSESQQWCEILDAENACDVNRMVHQHNMQDFIRINEALHDRSIAVIADKIVRRKARVIMVFGPSCSGKTTFANRLAVHLRVLGFRPYMLSLDHFYRNRSELPLEADGFPDLEHVDALDIPLFTTCIEELLAKREVEIPVFDFMTSSRCEKGTRVQLHDNDPIIIEGIHGLNDKITACLPEQLMFGVYVSALSCINLDEHNRIRTTDVRLIRRIVRDVQQRNTPVAETLRMWPNVRSGEERWIFPNQEKADVMFNTSLHYELPVLARIAIDKLAEVNEDDTYYYVAQRLLNLLHYFVQVDDVTLAEIPTTSILREFIGGNSFYN